MAAETVVAARVAVRAAGMAEVARVAETVVDLRVVARAVMAATKAEKERRWVAHCRISRTLADKSAGAMIFAQVC